MCDRFMHSTANDFLRPEEEYLIRAELLRKKWKDSDCHKTMIQTAGGGREGIRGGIQRRRQVWLWSWCGLGGNGTKDICSWKR